MTAKTQAPVKTETKPLNVDRSGILQRKCDCGKSASLTGQCSECNAKNLLQRRSTDSTEVAEVPPIVHEVLRSPGRALDSDTRTLMESRFGHDFSQVRVHTNSQAAQSAQSVNALAYTVGKNVVFGSGQYAPQTTAGKKVLAHELTHVLQQGSMSETIAPLRVGSSNDFYEQEAEAQAEKVVSTNEPIATPTQRHTSAVQRLGDLTKVPAGLSCPIATSGAPPATDSLLFANRGTALTPLQRMQIENVVINWRAAGASTPVRVDGFASQVGPDNLNWRLSCDRAQAVAAELQSPTSGAVRGIPVSFITVFAQGETNEFGAVDQNRRVAINTSSPAPTPTPTPPPPPLGCVTPTNPDMSGTAFNPTTDSQTTVIAKHPIDAFTVNSDANTALATASSSGLPGLHLGQADAFRHCLWNCSMTQDLGSGRAEQFATGHENSGPSPIPFDNQMDLHNNAMGRSLGLPGANCEIDCRNAVTSGFLRTIRGSHTRPPAVPPVATDCIGASNQPWP